MNDMVKYIFGSLQNSEMAISKINHALIKQAKINRRMSMALGITVGYMIALDISITNQNKQIEKLNKEIEELKHMKEE